MREILDSGDRTPHATFMKKNRSGAYWGCFTKKGGWFDRCESDKWEVFSDTCTQYAKNYKELPNWARVLLGVTLKKGLHDESKSLPPVVSEAIEMLIMHALSDGQEVTSAAVSRSIGWGLTIYNEEAKFVNALVKEHNDVLLKDLNERQYEFTGPSDVDDIVKDAWKYMPDVDPDKQESTMAYHTKCFKKKWGFGTYKQKKPERMLDKDDPKTVAYQDWINNSTENRGVHERLVAYWDQVWTLLYTPEEQLVWKSENKAGRQQDSFVHLFTQMCTYFYDGICLIVCTTETYIEKSSRGYFGLQLGTKRSSKKILEDGHLKKNG